MDNPIGRPVGRPVGRPRKLAEVIKSIEAVQAVKSREITSDEAAVLAKLGMSGADINDKARHIVTYYLQSLVSRDEIDDDEAKVCMDVLRQLATSTQKGLCNRVLAKYVSKFDFAQPKKQTVTV